MLEPGAVKGQAASQLEKVWRVKQRPSRRRHRTFVRVTIVVGALILMAAAAAAWLSFKANQIKAELQAATSVSAQLKDQLLTHDDVAAGGTLRELAAHTQAARSAVEDPIWTLAGAIPGFGHNFSAVSEIARSADDVVTGTAQPLLKVISSLDWESLKPINGKLNIEPLRASSPTIVSAANTLDLTHSRLVALQSGNLVPSVAVPLDNATSELSELRATLDTAASVSKVLPTMMGASEPRNYLVLVQNNAEIRATGGLPGALAVLRVDNGSIQLTDQSSGSAIGKFQPPVDVDPEQTQIFTSRLGTYISDVNLTPDFPTAASSAKKMWESRHKASIDGVIALDPMVLAHLLEATGPMKLTGAALPVGTDLPTDLTAKNVVQTLLSDVYSKLANNTAQDEYFAVVTREVFSGLTSGRASGKNLIEALTKSADENRLFIWSDHADEQKILAGTALGGSTSGPSVGGATFGAYFNDGTGAKMDFYVKRTVQLIQECPVDGYARVKVRVTVSNEAPLDAATALPTLVTGGGLYGVPPGSVQTNVVAYGPAQAQIETVHQDRVKTAFGSQLDGERPVGTLTTRLKPGQKSAVEFTFGKIVQSDDPALIVTPTVQPVDDVILAPKLTDCAAG
ncbi:hypothetical protein J2809_000058 [Arthrobacter pascens]|uniref:DUF4012 domain-containing protein n=1 Tax=Arthrobacter pascens TaxID=1677 RepID=UPI0028650122|nr:DUF4012 domain-containing protein [Arthrobacter pascens]MDR6555727.1 hypothetical protein [Arthrobacter pascens]